MLYLQYLLTKECDHAARMLDIYKGKSTFQSDAEPEAEPLSKSPKASGSLGTKSPEATRFLVLSCVLHALFFLTVLGTRSALNSKKS